MSSETFAPLDLHPSLSFASPPQMIDGSLQFVSFKPFKSEYQAGDTFDIKVQSSNEFVILDKSYCKFKLKGNHANASTMSVLGATAIIQSVTDTISGVQLAPLNNYNLFKSIDLNTDTANKKAINHVLNKYISEDLATATDSFTADIIQATESALASSVTMGSMVHSGIAGFNAPGYINTTSGSAFVSGSQIGTGMILPFIPTSLSSTTKYIPLPFLQGGWTSTIQLAPTSTVLPVLNSATTYYVEDFEFVLAMIKPQDQYLMDIQRGLSSGNSLKIPYEAVMSITQDYPNATYNSTKLQVGYKESVNQLLFFIRDKTYVNAAGYDTFKCSKLETITDFYTELNSQRYPRNKAVQIADGESLVQTLSSVGTSNELLNVVYQKPKALDRSFGSYTFKSSPSYASGVPAADGLITLNFNGTATANLRLDVFTTYSAMINVDSNTAIVSI
jgi:hypothetical protein